MAKVAFAPKQLAVENVIMKLIKVLVAFGCSIGLLTASAAPLGNGTSKPTCCQDAAAKGKDCRHKFCVAAHKEGKSCTKCNPNKENLKLKKDATKLPKAA